MKIRYELKSAIKNMLLFRCKMRYENYCNAVDMESNRLPTGVGIGYIDYWKFIVDDSWILFRIYNW